MLEEYASVSLDAGVRFQFGTGASALTSRTKLTRVIWRSREFGFSLKRIQRMVRMLDDIVESVIWLSI